MNDFLSELEHELVAAAQRRSSASRRQTDSRALGMVWIGDLRAMASGAMTVAWVGVVVLVVALIATSSMHRSAAHSAPASGEARPLARAMQGCGWVEAAGGRGWRVTRSPEAPQLSSLLRVGRPASARQRRAALRDLDESASGARSVYVHDIRVVRVSRGTRVTLLGVRSCMTAARSAESRPGAPQPAVVAELRSVHGVATILLGTVAQIRSGAAFRARNVLLKRPGGLASVAMVPARVVQVACHDQPPGSVQRIAVANQIAVLPPSTASQPCDLVYRGSAGASA